MLEQQTKQGAAGFSLREAQSRNRFASFPFYASSAINSDSNKLPSRATTQRTVVALERLEKTIRRVCASNGPALYNDPLDAKCERPGRKPYPIIALAMDSPSEAISLTEVERFQAWRSGLRLVGRRLATGF